MFAVAGAAGVVAAIVVADAVRGSLPSAATDPDATPVAVDALPDSQAVGPKTGV